MVVYVLANISQVVCHSFLLRYHMLEPKKALHNVSISTDSATAANKKHCILSRGVMRLQYLAYTTSHGSQILNKEPLMPPDFSSEETDMLEPSNWTPIYSHHRDYSKLLLELITHHRETVFSRFIPEYFSKVQAQTIPRSAENVYVLVLDCKRLVFSTFTESPWGSETQNLLRLPLLDYKPYKVLGLFFFCKTFRLTVCRCSLADFKLLLIISLHFFFQQRQLKKSKLLLGLTEMICITTSTSPIWMFLYLSWLISCPIFEIKMDLMFIKI